MTYACTKTVGAAAFRIPLGLQLMPPLFILTGAIFIPESPRWLTMQGKKETASRILAKYHGGGDVNHPMVQLEMREFEHSIELQKTSSIWNYLELVNSHNNRWRFGMMACMSVFAQMAGNSVLTYYLPSMYTLLGIKTTERRLLLSFMNAIVSCAGAVAGVGHQRRHWPPDEALGRQSGAGGHVRGRDGLLEPVWGRELAAEQGPFQWRRSFCKWPWTSHLRESS